MKLYEVRFLKIFSFIKKLTADTIAVTRAHVAPVGRHTGVVLVSAVARRAAPSLSADAGAAHAVAASYSTALYAVLTETLEEESDSHQAFWSPQLNIR